MEEGRIKIIEIRIALVGDNHAGKTKFIDRYLTGKFHEVSLSTTGISKSSKYLKLSNGKNINLILIDTAGWERAKSISFTAEKNSHGIV